MNSNLEFLTMFPGFAIFATENGSSNWPIGLVDNRGPGGRSAFFLQRENEHDEMAAARDQERACTCCAVCFVTGHSVCFVALLAYASHAEEELLHYYDVLSCCDQHARLYGFSWSLCRR